MKPLITVFTPTYNRAFCLGNLYQSLVRQSNKSFIWLIIDDGSTDETAELVESWISTGEISIQYHYQKNQGMHGAHNAAYQLINTELNVCIDSDDYMPDHAINKILNIWGNTENKTKLAGIIGLDAFKDGTPTGHIPEKFKYATLSELEVVNGIKGDKKVVLRTAVVKEYPPYPIYKEEKLVPLGSLYLQIDQDYKYVCTNEVFCIIEYLPDGSSKNILKQYKISPRGFLYSRILELKYSQSFTYSYTRAMHLVSSCLFIKKWFLFKENPNKLITVMAIPAGILLHLFILIKIKK
ncbi:glycosyltransferase family 2 protein [Robiginitalea sp. IMCC43444]|uniref:glycosyltransferase family 2 protein n=1 Tax=Robiginitalea sp. IMCC43444 TaxID=3459121 RepID=UPI0040429DBB